MSIAFHDAVDRAWLPILRSIGFTLVAPKRIKPGLVVAIATRPLDSHRRLEATLWCEGSTGRNLRFRLDIVEPINGTECHREIDLDVKGEEFLPHESPERLRMAITFLAGAFAAKADRLVEAVPELTGELRTAASTNDGQAAIASRPRSGSSGTCEARPVSAKVVFGSDKLVYLDADGVRVMFRVPVTTLDRGQPIIVSGWCRTAAGAQVATTLVHAGRTWRFDLRGELVPG